LYDAFSELAAVRGRDAFRRSAGGVGPLSKPDAGGQGSEVRSRGRLTPGRLPRHQDGRDHERGYGN
jgi:hypothetical protein